MFGHCFSEATSLFSYIRRIHLIENWENILALGFLTLNYVHQFIQTPGRRCIILREYNNRNGSFLYRFEKGFRNLLTPFELVVYEDVDPLLTQGHIKMTGEIGTSILSSETQKNIITPFKSHGFCCSSGRTHQRNAEIEAKKNRQRNVCVEKTEQK